MQIEGAKGAKALNRKYTDIILIILIPKAAIYLHTPDDYEQLLYIL